MTPDVPAARTARSRAGYYLRRQLAGFEPFVQIRQIAIRFQTNEPKSLSCRQPDEPPDKQNEEEMTHLRPADGRIDPAGIQRAGVGERPTAGPGVDDQVVTTAVPGEVFFPIVDHVVEADRPHHRELLGAVDTGDFGPLRLRDLNADRAHAPASAVDQDRLARFQRPSGEERLHCELAGLRQRRCLFIGHT